MNLSEIYTEETVIEDLKGADKDAVLEEMVAVLERLKLIPARKAPDLKAALVRREQMGSTGIGRGIAVPHVKHKSLAGLVGVLGRSKGGVEFQALDGAPVHLIFMLISGENLIEPHLNALKKISALSSDEDMLRFLRNAKDRSEIAELIKEADERVEV